jgi:hypothetical protein
MPWLPGVFHEGETEPLPSSQRDIYERFLSCEVLTDDEDDDFCPPSNLYEDEDEDDEDTGVDTPGEETDTLALYQRRLYSYYIIRHDTWFPCSYDEYVAVSIDAPKIQKPSL